ncbi:unnamed protein product [Boreogadus saida]
MKADFNVASQDDIAKLLLPLLVVTANHLAFPRNYHFILDDTEVCRSNTPFLVLVVSVAPGNRKARDAIRKTWGTETLVQGELIQTVFLLGLPSGGNITELQEHVSMENLQHCHDPTVGYRSPQRLGYLHTQRDKDQRSPGTERDKDQRSPGTEYHDLIQSDFTDSYNNLTIKTMVIMDWLATRCSLLSPSCPLEVETLVSPTCPLEEETLVSPTCPLEEETLVSPTCPLLPLRRSPSGANEVHLLYVLKNDN